jgi:hypothetical protein
MKSGIYTHCLWCIKDTGEVYMDLIREQPESINFGGHVPFMKGSKSAMNRLLKRFQAKPCLVEKYIHLSY